MKKVLQFAICVAALLLLCSCGAVSQDVQPLEDTEIYLIPNSYFEYTGTDVSESAQAYLELGSDYCTDACVVAEGMEVTLTETQRDNLIARNNEFIEILLTKFTAENELYHYVADATYQQLSFYFDEELSATLQVQSVFGTASGYGLNYILLNNSTDWNVAITIYNCHTEKEVMSVTIPSEEASYGAAEWEESYRVE